MPIATAVIDQRELTIFTLTGAVGYADLKDAARTFYAQHPTRHTLLDVRQARLQGLCTEDVSSFASIVHVLAAEHGTARIAGKAAAVASTDLAYGLVRMYGRLLGEVPYELRIMRTMNDALEWLLA